MLVVVNKRSTASQGIGAYYVHKREVPLAQVCKIDTPEVEEISRDIYEKEVEGPIDLYLRQNHLIEKIYYIVTTLGVPLKIAGTGEGMETDAASVDSELAAMYGRKHGQAYPYRGAIRNPYYQQVNTSFSHPQFPLYLVTRLAGYSLEDVRGIIDRALVARNKGVWVIDVRADNNTPGNDWLRNAAKELPKDRLVLDDSAKVIYDEKNVIGYASWGFNDPDRHRRHLGFQWLPGAIATEFVSTNARTFARPPDAWTLGTWKNPLTWFAGSPQTMTADFIHDGATLATGHVYEPFLGLIPRPDFLLPAYFHGRNFAESFYLSLPALSWQNVAIGDPLCRLK